MTGDLSAIPYRELDRIHEQAQVALRDGLLRGSEPIYRAGEDLEQRCRREKIRRQVARQ